MTKIGKGATPASPYLLPLTLLNAIIIKYGYTGKSEWSWLLCITVPLLFVSLSKRRKRNIGSKPALPVLRQVRYSIEPVAGERLRKKRERAAYGRFRVFNKHS